MKSRKLCVLMKLYIYGKVYFYYRLPCFTANIKKKKKNQLDRGADQNKFRNFLFEISQVFTKMVEMQE